MLPRVGLKQCSVNVLHTWKSKFRLQDCILHLLRLLNMGVKTIWDASVQLDYLHCWLNIVVYDGLDLEVFSP